MSSGIYITVDKASVDKLKALMGALPAEGALKGLAEGARRVVKTCVASAQTKLDAQIYAQKENPQRKRTKLLRKAVSTKVRVYPRELKLYAGVGIDPSVSGVDENGNRSAPVKYAHLIEYGHVIRNRKSGPSFGVVPPRPFMRPAMETLGPDRGASVLVDTTMQAIDKLIQKARNGR